MAKKPTIKDVTFEHARIGFPNFAGKPGKMNADGKRNFLLFIDNPEDAEAMKRDGWNIKYLKPRDEDEEPQAFVQVQVKYEFKPPKIVLVNNGRKTPLGEHEIDILDWAEIDYVDITLNPSWYDFNGKQGYTAYCKTLFVVIKPDPLAEKYADLPDTGRSEGSGVQFEGEEPF